MKTMKTAKSILKPFIILLFIILIISCEKPETEVRYDNPQTLDLTEFTFLPQSPTIKEETNVVFYGCQYYATSSVIIKSPDIQIKKRFNSQLKWPCVLKYDTINLGKLHKGDYKVTLQIIDFNPSVKDSVFHSETKSLTISNK